MKINANYKTVLDLKDRIMEANLNNAEGFTVNVDELKLLRQIMAAAQGDIFPSRDELEAQHIRVRALENLDYDKHRERWNSLMAECNEFEGKFC